MTTTDVVPIFLRVARRDIAFIKFVFESYEDVAIVRTVDRKTAVIVVLAVPDAVEHTRAILASLDCVWQEVPPPTESDDWLFTGSE
ncbi:MAG: DUF4911 domain-containing protein [Deltaproteobacteria bacterium]|nr:DUF4911 domain-containing protein [Deltaproteobacteria bacterium]MBI3388423.1 DUF4911 domain-containing protein [Deltaproteobacteria bacterium]